MARVDLGRARRGQRWPHQPDPAAPRPPLVFRSGNLRPRPPAGDRREVAAAFVLEPVLAPAADFLHGLELAGVLIGVVTGQMHLAILCAKHWLNDEVGSAIAAMGERLVKGPGDEMTRARRLETVSGNSHSPSGMMTGRGESTLSPESVKELADAIKDPESTRNPVAATNPASEPVSRQTRLAGGLSSL